MDGTGPSDLPGAPYHSYSFFVAAAGTYVITSGSGDPDSPVDWRGLVALYGPPFDPARPLQSLIAVDYFDVGVEPAARLEALLMSGVVYRVVTSNVEDEANFYPYSSRIEGPTEPEVGGNHLFASACYPIGDELDFHDDDRSGFAVQRARFCVEADWATIRGESGVARAVPYRTDESVLFWFFAPHNWELQVKVLDGCFINGHFWVSYSANTSVELDIRVFGRGVNHGNPALVRSYHEEQGHRAGGRIDTTAFRCEEVRPEYGPPEPRDEGVFLMRACRGSEHAPQGELFRALLRGPELVAEAESRIGTEIYTTIFAGPVLRGDGGFNAPWSWHHDPAEARFVEGAIEACEGCPSFVEDDIDYWVDNLGQYCPFVEVLRRER